MKRRKFLKTTSSSVLGAAILPSFLSFKSKTDQKPYGLGIYTIREELSSDFIGSLKKVAKIGFTDLELWNYENGKIFGYTPKDLKLILDDLGLKSSSLHVGVGLLTNNLEEVIEASSILNGSYVVCNYLQENERASLDDYKKHVDLFNGCGEKSKSAGLQFCYHNHDFEFLDFNGEKPYNILLEECDNELVQFEMDIHWMNVAKENPVEYFKRYPKRFPLWHVKDSNVKGEFTPIGTGITKWPELFQNADLAGLKQYFVEQDDSPNGDPFADIKSSLKYLKKNQL